jgi:metallophosphoesterase superfamily enzyme
MMQGLGLELCGERLWLHPERAVVWPRHSTVIVADTHFGKSAIFGQHGIAVPGGADALDFTRLERLLQESAATRLLILGDFLHGAVQAGSTIATQLTAWLESLLPVRVQVVAGNHDRRVLQLWRPPVQWESTDLREGPFRFVHEALDVHEVNETREAHAGQVDQADQAARDVQSVPVQVAAAAQGSYSFSGHVHPVLRIGGRRKRATRVPVFWATPRGMVLPSFGLFTGGAVIRPAPDDAVYVVGPERVVKWRAL